MNAKQKQPMLPAQELQYTRNAAGEYVLYCAKYTAEDGSVVGPKYQADFGGSLCLLDMQICVLQLKLRLDKPVSEPHPTHYCVMVGEQARLFATTLAQIRKVLFSPGSGAASSSDKMYQWYLTLFGNVAPFFDKMARSNPRTIAVAKTHPDMPRSIKVELLDSLPGAANRTNAVLTKEAIEEIIDSLKRQAEVMRARHPNRSGGSATGATPTTDTTFIRSARPGHAWTALEQLLRVFADPSNKFNRLYAIDRLEESVWRDTRTFAYLGLQAREYMKAKPEVDPIVWTTERRTEKQ